MKTLLHCCLLLTLMLTGVVATAERAQQFGPYKVHYSVVNTTFVDPEVASRYQIVRGEKYAFLNVAVRQQLPNGGSKAVSAKLEGRSWDLFQNQFFEFREIREQDAIYYIGSFEFSDEDIRFFNVQILPEGAQRSYNLKFQQKVYVD
jgi:hypothetical protein